MEEIWKAVKDYEGLYEVSNTGLVKRITQKIQIGNRSVLFNGNAMIPLDNGKGYLRVKLSKKDKSRRIMLHRIIAEAFVQNPNNYKVVNHKNGDKKDNRIENLEWCTQSYNCKHAFDIGIRTTSEATREERRIRIKRLPRGEHGQLMKIIKTG